MSIDTAITDAFRQWLDGEFPIYRVRELESGQGLDSAWQALQHSGFCDALIGETQGGAGISLETAAQLLIDSGRAALPLPFAATLWVRAALAARELTPPDGPITLALGRRDGTRIECPNADFGRLAEWVLVVLAGEALLLPADEAERQEDGIHGSLSARLIWNQMPADSLSLGNDLDWQLIGATLFAAQIAGAAERALSMALAYAGDRQQFGKPIGKFQALQQRLAVMAEEAFAVRMAVQLALRGHSLVPAPQAAMVAKARCSAAVPEITAVAHLVHGAIGVTEEHDLQLFSRRLYDWRGQFGSESYWYRRLGSDVLNSNEPVIGLIQRWQGDVAAAQSR